MSRADRATAGVIPAACLLLATACSVASGGGGSSDYRLRPAPAPSPAVTDSAGLNQVALGSQDVAGQKVTTPLGGAAPNARDVSADSACRPLANAVAGVPVGSPDTTSARRAAGRGVTSLVTLAAYKGESAAVTAMTELSDAADACVDGFTLTVKKQQRRVTKVTRELAPTGTDQAMAFGVTTEREGIKATVKVVVFRKGATVGYLSATPTGAPEDVSASLTDVVQAQLLKLG